MLKSHVSFCAMAEMLAAASCMLSSGRSEASLLGRWLALQQFHL